MSENKWIAVKEGESPEFVNKPYLVLINGAFRVGYVRSGDLEQWRMSGTGERIYPSHYLSLPDPPPKPDAFEEWWQSRKFTGGCNHEWRTLDNSTVINKASARIAWDAALAFKP